MVEKRKMEAENLKREEDVQCGTFVYLKRFHSIVLLSSSLLTSLQ